MTHPFSYRLVTAKEDLQFVFIQDALAFVRRHKLTTATLFDSETPNAVATLIDGQWKPENGSTSAHALVAFIGDHF